MAAAYTAMLSLPSTPAPDPIFTIMPLLLRRICGTTARASRYGPKNTVSNCRRTSSSRKLSAGPWTDHPALLTSTSMATQSSRHSSCSTSSAARVGESTSSARKRLPLEAWDSTSATRAGGRAEGLRAVAMTVCEWARARRVRARPKPEEQPVMRKVSLGGSQDDIVSALQRSSRGVELRLELLVETSESSGSNLQRLAASIYTRRKRIRPAHASTNPGPRTPLLSHGELCVSL